MKEQVESAIKAAFETQDVDISELQERDGRVYGFVHVLGSELFSSLDGIRRQQRLWKQLRDDLGIESLNVGTIVLQGE